MDEAVQESGEWIFVDPGFSSNRASCGLLVGDAVPVQLTFSALCGQLTAVLSDARGPVNLALEAPLSVAFGQAGNPVGRSIEKRKGMARYWYVGLGCSVLISAMYLMRAITEVNAKVEVRLFEGLVSFKERGAPSSHLQDVLDLRSIVRRDNVLGRVVGPDELAASPSDRLCSAFQVAGMDYGVPPVIAVGA